MAEGYYDGYGNYIDPEEAQRLLDQDRANPGLLTGGDGTPPAPPAAASNGGGGGGGGDYQRQLNELLGAGYNGPTDPASVASAYARTVNGGNAGGGSTGAPGAPGGGNSYIGGIDWYRSMAEVAQAQANLEYLKERMQKVEIVSLDDARQVQQWLKEYRDAQMALEQKKQAATEAYQQQTEARLGREFGVNTQMDIWREQQQLAQQNALNTGMYRRPDANPTLPFDYLAGEYGKDFERYHGRAPTQQETQDQFMWSDRRPGEPQPARPWDYLNRSTDLPQAPRDLGSTPNSEDPGALSLNDATAGANADFRKKYGRDMTEPELRSWVTGKFDPEHPHVLSGKVQAGTPMAGPEWARDWDKWRAYLPKGYREQYKVNTGQDVGARPAQAPSAPGTPPQQQPAATKPVYTDMPVPGQRPDSDIMFDDQLRQDARRNLQQYTGREWSEPEFSSWVTGRFDPQHPHVLSGNARAGDLLTGEQWQRPYDELRSSLPDEDRNVFEQNTGRAVPKRPPVMGVISNKPPPRTVPGDPNNPADWSQLDTASNREEEDEPWRRALAGISKRRTA